MEARNRCTPSGQLKARRLLTVSPSPSLFVLNEHEGMSTPDTHHLSHSLQQPNANLADQLFPPSPPRQHPAAPLPKIKLSVAKWLTKNPDHSSTASSNGGYDDDDAPDERAMNRSRSRSSRAPAAASSKKRSTRGNSAVSYQETDEYESSGGGGGRATRGRSTRNGDASMDSTLDANGTYEEDGEDQVEEVVHINGVAGSEQDGEGEMDEDAVVVEDDDEDDEDDQPVVRRRAKVIKQLSDSEEPELVAREPQLITTTSAHGRRTTRPAQYGGSTDDDDFQEDKPKRGGLRRGGSSRRNNDDFVDADEEYDREDDGYGVKRSGRVRQKRQQEDQRKQNLRLSRRQQAVLAKKSESTRSTRNSAKADLSFDNEGEGEAEESTDSDGSDDLLLDDEDDEDGQGAPRNLRQKPKVDYYSMAPLEAPRDKGKGKAKGKQRSAGYGGDPFSGLPVNMTAEMWQTLYPEKNGGQSSVSLRSPLVDLVTDCIVIGLGRRRTRILDSKESSPLRIHRCCRRCGLPWREQQHVCRLSWSRHGGSWDSQQPWQGRQRQ